MAKKAIRPIRIEGNIAYITLTKGYEAVIDIADAPSVAGFNWQALEARRSNGSLRSVYAVRSVRCGGKKHDVRMHVVLAGSPDHSDVDHIDGDGLNNRRSNIRPATRAQNLHNARIKSTNKSGVKGVHWVADSGTWRSQIRANGKRICLGDFKCRTAAALAYAKASTALHGEFARTG